MSYMYNVIHVHVSLLRMWPILPYMYMYFTGLPPPLHPYMTRTMYMYMYFIFMWEGYGLVTD